MSKSNKRSNDNSNRQDDIDANDEQQQKKSNNDHSHSGLISQDRLIEMTDFLQRIRKDVNFPDVNNPHIDDILINSSGDEIGTLLHVFCEIGRIDEVRELIAGQADLDKVCSASHSSALSLGCISGSVEILEALITAGAKLSEENNLGMTLLHITASGFLHEDVKMNIAQLLLPHIDVGKYDFFSKTAQDYALDMGCENLAEILQCQALHHLEEDKMEIDDMNDQLMDISVRPSSPVHHVSHSHLKSDNPTQSNDGHNR